MLFGPDEGYLDCELRYTNMFCAQYDAVLHALKKLEIPGADGMEVNNEYFVFVFLLLLRPIVGVCVSQTRGRFEVFGPSLACVFPRPGVT